MENNEVVNTVVETVAEKAPEIVEAVAEKAQQVQQAIQPMPIEMPSIITQVVEKKILGMSEKTVKDLVVLGVAATCGAIAHKGVQVVTPKVKGFFGNIWNKLTAPKPVNNQAQQPAPAPAAAQTVEAQPVQQATVVEATPNQENK